MIRIGIFGSLGYERAEELLRSHKEELEERFSGRFLEGFRQLAETRCEPILSSDHTPEEGYAGVPEAQEDASSAPLFRLFPIGEGGLFAGLWKLCEEVSDPADRPDTGCRVDVLQVPVPQEVVEICELYDENPYEVSSPGCFLVVWDEERQSELPKDCLRIIEKSVMIGRLTADHRRVLVIADRTRFLTPPERQRKDMENRRAESLPSDGNVRTRKES